MMKVYNSKQKDCFYAWFTLLCSTFLFHLQLQPQYSNYVTCAPTLSLQTPPD